MDFINPSILLSALATLIALASACYTYILARNSTLALKRPQLVIEPEFQTTDVGDGWQHWEARIQNNAPASARITGARTKKRKIGLQHLQLDYKSDAGDVEVTKLQPTSPAVKKLNINLNVAPTGAGPNSVVHVQLCVKGARSPHDVILDWEWADGTYK